MYPDTLQAEKAFKIQSDSPDGTSAQAALSPSDSAGSPSLTLVEAQSTSVSSPPVGNRPEPSTAEHKARTAWAWMAVGVEVQPDQERSAFYFEKDGKLMHDTVEGVKAQARFSSYSSEVFIRQHRVFHLVIYICGDRARLARCDRCGCLVSTHVPLRDILTFVYRLALMSDEELGYDTTAELASEDEVKVLDDVQPLNPYAKRCADNVREDVVFYPIYKARSVCLCLINRSAYYSG